MKSSNSVKLGIEFYVHHFRRMKSVTRFSTTPKVGREQSVAEHTLNVIYLSIFISESLFKDKGIDNYKLVKKALSHDTIEVFTGDIVKPFKVYSGKKFKQSLNEIENKLISDIENYFDIEVERMNDDIESDIVLLADVVEALCFAYEQINFGNKFFNTHSISMLKVIKDIIGKYIYKHKIDRYDANNFLEYICGALNKTGSSTEVILSLGKVDE